MSSTGRGRRDPATRTPTGDGADGSADNPLPLSARSGSVLQVTSPELPAGRPVPDTDDLRLLAEIINNGAIGLPQAAWNARMSQAEAAARLVQMAERNLPLRLVAEGDRQTLWRIAQAGPATGGVPVGGPPQHGAFGQQGGPGQQGGSGPARASHGRANQGPANPDPGSPAARIRPRDVRGRPSPVRCRPAPSPGRFRSAPSPCSRAARNRCGRHPVPSPASRRPVRPASRPLCRVRALRDRWSAVPGAAQPRRRSAGLPATPGLQQPQGQFPPGTSRVRDRSVHRRADRRR